MKYAHIPVLKQIIFQRFQFYDFFVRPVFYCNASIIRQTRHRAYRCELGLGNGDINLSFSAVLIFDGIKYISPDNPGFFNLIGRGFLRHY